MKEIPSDDAFVSNMLSSTLNGQMILTARSSNPSLFEGTVNMIKDAINRINSRSLSPVQKATIFNGGSTDGLDSQMIEDIRLLRTYGILAEANS